MSTPRYEWNKEFNAWFEIVMKAIQSPFKKIILNWGENADSILWKVIEWESGYNSLTQVYENLFESGIIDPKMVVQNELINAASTAAILLTSSVAIVNEVEEK
jgi:chaperonin GroEL